MFTGNKFVLSRSCIIPRCAWLAQEKTGRRRFRQLSTELLTVITSQLEFTKLSAFMTWRAGGDRLFVLSMVCEQSNQDSREKGSCNSQW